MAWHSMPVTKDGKADEIVVLYCTVEDNVDSNCMDLPIVSCTVSFLETVTVFWIFTSAGLN